MGIVAHKDVLADRHRVEDAAALGNVADAHFHDFMRRDIVYLLLLELDGRARRALGKTGNCPQSAGFAGAVRANERNDLALSNAEADVVDALDRAILYGQMVDF